MHYILGTSFQIPSANQQQLRPSVITSATGGSTMPSTAREWNDFDTGHSYTLYNIEKIEEGVRYTFRSQTGAAQVQKVFESASQGDAYISSIKREQLPDYDSFYEKRND